MSVRSVRAARPPIRAVCAIRAVLEGELGHLVRCVHGAVALGEHLARRARVAGRHIHDRVVREEVARPQQQRDGLDRHDGEVLGRRDVRDAERVPQHHVCVLDRLCAVADPLRQAHRGLARSLRDVAASWPKLVIRICYTVSQIEHDKGT